MKTTDSRILAQRKQELQFRLRRTSPLYSSDADPALWFEISDRHRASSYAGIAALLELARATGLDQALDSHLDLLKDHRPYTESDHILALAVAVLAGGQCPEHLRTLRQTPEFLDLLGLERLPDSTTAGDFLRRFETEEHAKAFMKAVLLVTEQVLLARLSDQERQTGRLDADGTFTSTGAECRQGIEWSGHKKDWGYHPLLVSLANTNQPLLIKNRPGNEVSSHGAAEYLDMAIESMLRVFAVLLLRGDTDFSQTRHLDRWDETGRVKFVFGYDACPNLVARAEALRASEWRQLVRPARYEVKTRPRTKPERIKPELVKARGFRTLRTVREDVAEFDYQPVACKKSYRMVVVKKQIEVSEGQLELEPETRYFFYITNRRDLSREEVVGEANQRCNQENLIAQLSGQVHSLKATSNTLFSNWGWMLSASLGWTLKSWFALFAPKREERERLLGMEWRTFLWRFVSLPGQIVESGRRRVVRLLGGHLPSLGTFLSITEEIRRLRLIRT